MIEKLRQGYKKGNQRAFACEIKDRVMKKRRVEKRESGGDKKKE